MRRGRPSLWMWVLLSALATALVSIVIAILDEGPDRSIRGTVTRVEAHEICLAAPGDGGSLCEHVDSPGDVAGIAVGDCVQLTGSAEGLLESVELAEGCR